MYRITHVLDLFKGEHEQALSHAALKILLRSLFDIDRLELRADKKIPLLYESGVRYEEEPPGQEDWQDVRTCLKMGIGDCEDLACWRAAEYVERYNIQARPCFVWKKQENGGMLYHIQVRLPDGRIEDPSRVLGMR